MDRIALIGFGEAAEAFATANCWEGRAHGYDREASRRAAMPACGVKPDDDAAGALRGASIVLSLVTADAASFVARECAPFLQPGAMWIDMNSVSPETKRQAANWIEDAGGHYVDAAILAPVLPAHRQVPILLSGPFCDEARESLSALGFGNLRCVSGEVGQAAAIKLIRSIMVKGIEALTSEMMEAAGAAGVTAEVLASLDASERALPWPERAAYNLERMATHGERRAAEMKECASALRALGVEPVMAERIAVRQKRAARSTSHAKDAA
jgi:3-hydroxyisobutyrate dehydrogenase-like beta-hydroxyacid dehydrogenase